jgi:hypothetical protein
VSGLTLADIDLYLTAENRSTGVLTVIWNGAQNPTAEDTNTRTYYRIYTGADLDLNNYFARAVYTGATSVDATEVYGSTGVDEIPLGTAIAYTYIATDSSTGLPLQGTDVEISTDLAGANIIWRGTTDAFGVARNTSNNLPRLDTGTYYFWRKKSGYTFSDPDTEIVSDP